MREREKKIAGQRPITGSEERLVVLRILVHHWRTVTAVVSEAMCLKLTTTDHLDANISVPADNTTTVAVPVTTRRTSRLFRREPVSQRAWNTSCVPLFATTFVLLRASVKAASMRGGQEVSRLEI